MKTGKKAWDQKRVDGHGQIDMYCLMNYVATKVKPEEMDIQLVWLPTMETGSFEIGFVKPFRVEVFFTKRTMMDILKFGNRIKETVIKMEKYVQNHA
jgi:hypothetical protein